MVVWPGKVPDSVVDFFIGVAGALGAELPDCPLIAVFGVEKGDELVERVAIGALWIGAAGPRGGDDCGEEMTC